jgi:hypothetical protein
VPSEEDCEKCKEGKRLQTYTQVGPNRADIVVLPFRGDSGNKLGFMGRIAFENHGDDADIWMGIPLDSIHLLCISVLACGESLGVGANAIGSLSSPVYSATCGPSQWEYETSEKIKFGVPVAS